MTHPLTDLLPTTLRHKLRTGRDLARAKRRAVEDSRLSTACEPLDALLGGGLARGRLVELVAWGSSGRFATVLGALAAVTQGGEAAALVDLGDALAPHDAARADIVLERLLWIRPRTMKEALMATEAVVACGMPLVALDLGVPPVPGGRGSEAFWLRLVRAAEKHRTAIFVASPYRVTGTTAHQVLELGERRARWTGTELDPRLLTGLGSHLRLTRAPGHVDAAPRALDLTLPSAVAADPPPAPQSATKKVHAEKTARSGAGPVLSPVVPRRAVPQSRTADLDPLMTSQPRKAIA